MVCIKFLLHHSGLMMKNKKLDLISLKVTSFITNIDEKTSETAKGGSIKGLSRIASCGIACITVRENCNLDTLFNRVGCVKQ